MGDFEGVTADALIAVDAMRVGTTSAPGQVEGRCSECGLAFVVSELASKAGAEPVCGDCGCPIYVVGEEPEGEPEALADLLEVLGCSECERVGGPCVDHALFWNGWDACVAVMAGHVEGTHSADDLDPFMSAVAEVPMHCTGYVPGDPGGCARCGERADLHDGTRGTS